jgi:glucose-1-phosphate cytidylyltransferase
MKTYSHYGFNEFILCLGYKGEYIRNYFLNYDRLNSDLRIDMKTGDVEVFNRHEEHEWQITLVDTGLNTMTGGRVKQVGPYLDDETFLLTYGDGVGDVDVQETIAFHRSHGKAATMTVAQPPGRFGQVKIDGDVVASFQEKPIGEGGWINAGFFVMEPRVLEYIAGDSTVLEREPLEGLAAAGELIAHRHRGFWLPMDTLRDKKRLEDLWASDAAPWKVWK